jgi:hypothetical protein
MGRISTGGVAPVSITLDHSSIISYKSTRWEASELALRIPKTFASQQLLHGKLSRGWTGHTKTHDDAVAKPLRVLHQIVWSDAEITQHLHRFRILQLYMLLLTAIFVEIVVNQFPKGSPFIPVAHDQKMVSMGHQVMRDIGRWPIAVYSAFLVDEAFYQTPVANDHCRCWAYFEGEYSPILLSPLREPFN